MATINLSSSFTPIAEGTYVFKITDVVYDETFGKIEVAMENSKGRKHTERFRLLNANGETNAGALNAFSFFAKTALNNFDAESIDHADLIGRYIRAEVKHTTAPSRDDPNKTVTFVNLGDKSPADGFDDIDITVSAGSDVDLLDLLK